MAMMVNSCYVCLRTLKKKGQGCSERTGEQTTAAQLWKLAIRLMSSWQVGGGSVTSRGWESRAPAWFPPQNPPGGQEACFWNEGWDSPQGGAGLGEGSCISAPTSPFLLLGACCLTPLLKSGDLLSGKCESGGRALFR